MIGAVITSNGWPIATTDTRRMTGGHLVLEVVASLRYETPSLVLSVRTLTGLERSDPRGACMDNSMHIQFSADEHTTVFLPELSEGTLYVSATSPAKQVDDRWPSRPGKSGQSPVAVVRCWALS